MQNKLPKKSSYRITARDEALGYAKTAKRQDRSSKWAILEAKIDINNNECEYLNNENIDNLYSPKKQSKSKITIYPTSKFNILVLPNMFLSRIQNSKIVEIV